MKTTSLKTLFNKMQYRAQAFASYLLIIFLLIALSPAGFAKSKLDGDWEGMFENPKLPMIFHIRMKEGCTVDSPTQGIHGMPVYVTVSGKTVYISMLSGVATFEGTFEGSRIVGTFSETGSKWPLTLIKSKKHDKL